MSGCGGDAAGTPGCVSIFPGGRHENRGAIPLLVRHAGKSSGWGVGEIRDRKTPGV